MRKYSELMVIFAFAAIVAGGCGGGGSAPATSTTTVTASGGSATVTAAQNASANTLVNDFSNTGWKIYLPAGTLAADTTFSFADLSPGIGGVPAVPADRILGVSLEISATPAIPSGKTLTLINDASEDTDIATGNTVDLMKVVSGAWTDVGAATKYSDGTLRADVTGFSQISLGVRDAAGTYDETFTITSSTNSGYCGTVGSIDVSNSIITQDGVVMAFNPNDAYCNTTGKMQANGAFTGSISCTQVSEGCTRNTTGTFNGRLDISVSPKEYFATVSETYSFSGSCGAAPASCTMGGTAEGILSQ